MEAALQAYLTSCALDEEPASAHAPDFVSEPMGVLGAALASQPDLSIGKMLSACGQQAPLTLRLALQLQLLDVSGQGPMQWMPTAVDCVRSVASCRVHAAREFELLPLWFLVLELLSDASWLTDYSAAVEAITAFSRAIQTACGTLSAVEMLSQGSLWDSFGKEPPPPLQLPGMQLAARAIVLYLNHALDAKARGMLRTPAAVDLSGGTNEALKAQNTALLRCAQSPSYRVGFEGFFDAVQSMCARAAPVPLVEFKMEVVRGLLPMAPYLAGL